MPFQHVDVLWTNGTFEHSAKYNLIYSYAGVSEWSNVPVSKTGVPQGIEGSNPSPCAKAQRKENFAKCLFFY